MDRREIYRRALSHFLVPIQAYLEDPAISEVMINGPGEIYVERAGRLELVEVSFPSPHSLQAAIRNILQYAGKRLTEETQSYDARLPDGSRVHILLSPSSRERDCVTIRKFSRSLLGLSELVARGALSEAVREFLELAVLLEKNILISGGTGSGKTTLLNCLSGAIPEGQRVVVIEDSSELQLQRAHVLYLEVRPPDRHGRGAMSIRDLFRASLRMRPDRIVIGEVRGGEALDLIQAMTSGHGGSLTTAHANSPADALRRLETMAMMSDIELPLLALRSQGR
jgi:pilus assembly protein CpaF